MRSDGGAENATLFARLKLVLKTNPFAKIGLQFKSQKLREKRAAFSYSHACKDWSRRFGAETAFSCSDHAHLDSKRYFCQDRLGTSIRNR